MNKTFTNNSLEVINKVLLRLSSQKARDNTLELRDVCLNFDPREQYLDFGETKKSNREYIKNEIEWYCSKDRCIFGHKGIESNKIWKQCATENGIVNSNYGYLVFSASNFNQYDYALQSLIKNKYTRQSVIIYNRPQIQIEHDDGINANHDFICTMYTHQFIENDNTFTYIVYMRSNDIIYGLPNDYSWHYYVYHKMFNELKEKYPELKIGKIIWHAGSLHIYERHYDLLDKIIKEYLEWSNSIQHN
jgi:thymidylate synthase